MNDPTLSSGSPEWYTPKELIEVSRRVLGVIEFDPFSSSQAQEVVQAKYGYLCLYDKETGHSTLSGYDVPWGTVKHPLSVWVNPPGDRTGKAVVKAWHKLLYEVSLGRVKHGLFLSFNMSTLRTTQRRQYPSLTTYPTCIFSTRINFWQPNNPAPGNTRDSCITYVRGTCDNTALFYHLFSPLGDIIQQREYDEL